MFKWLIKKIAKKELKAQEQYLLIRQATHIMSLYYMIDALNSITIKGEKYIEKEKVLKIIKG
jgi:hypothetical protein